MHGFGAKCGCRVPHQGHVIAEFWAAAGGSLDAGIGQHPYHDDLFDAALLELESATGIDGVPTRKLRFAGDPRWREPDSNRRSLAERPVLGRVSKKKRRAAA